MIRRPLKAIKICAIFLLATFVINFLSESFIFKNSFRIFKTPLELANLDIYPRLKNYSMKDWHDYDFIAYEATRSGLGENGSKVILINEEEIKKNQKVLEVEGLSGYISDLISINRSLPDVRHPLCRRKFYLANLPPVTIIIIFHNEIPSLIKRTLHSITNRTPAELIDEIILVNDASTRHELFDQLETYINENFNTIKIVRLKTRVGLIKARMEGFRRAKSEIVVFLDSHIEVGTNWLPPLIEPIAMNPRVSTIPIHDKFSWLDFGYESADAHGVRGLFAWDFDYRVIRRPLNMPTMPKRTPIMLGCAFAINRKYFQDLGGYDEGLEIWNGENYELSLKLHLCGGDLLEVPCSRIAHVFRARNIFRKTENNDDFVARNFKRIAEVWLDDWKKYLYKTNLTRFAVAEAGDLKKQLEIRRKLNCKPFDYFVYAIAPEMVNVFGVPRDDDIAYGSLSVTFRNKTFCITDVNGFKSCKLDECDKNPASPNKRKFLHFNPEKGIEHDRTKMCLDKKQFSRELGYVYKKNFWKYSFKTHQIMHVDGHYCIAANFQKKSLMLRPCNSSIVNQIWTFGSVWI